MQTAARLQTFRSGFIPAVFVVLLFLLAVLFLYLTANLDEAQEDKHQRFLQEVLYRSSHSIFVQLQGRIRYLQGMAVDISQQWPLPEASLRALLQKNNAVFKSKRMGFIDAEGNSVSSSGTPIPHHDKELISQVFRGQTVLGNTIPDPDDTLPVNILSVPVHVGDQVLGMLCTVMDSEELRMVLEVPLFQGIGSTYVFSDEGRGVSLGFGRRMLQNDLFAGLGEATLVQPPLDTVRSNLLQNKHGTVLFRQRNNDYYLSYVPLGINNWYVAGIVPTNFTEAKATSTVNITLILLTLTALLFLGLIYYVVCIQRRMRREAVQQASRMSTLVRNIPGGVVRSRDDAVWTLEEYSEGFLNLIGYSAEEVKNIFNNQMFRIIHPKDRDMVQRVEDEGGGVHMEYRIKRKDGRNIWVAEHSQLVEEADGAHWFAVMLDISSSHNAQERRRVDEERYRILFEMSDAILYEYDMRTSILHTTRQFFEKFGYPAPESLAAQHAVGLEIIHPEDRETFASLHEALREGESSSEALIRIRHYNGGEWLWCHVQQTALLDTARRCIKALGKITNVDAETRALHRLRDEVQRDPFTGLFNKIATATLVDQALTEVEAEQGNALCALCVIDVDNFKSVNDCMGHHTGDIVLKELSAALTELFRASDIVGRVGGDEFVVFMRDVKQRQSVEIKMAQVQQAFRKDFKDSHCPEVHISASIGIALFPEDGEGFSTLFPRADKALYHSKKSKDAVSFYDAERDAS